MSIRLRLTLWYSCLLAVTLLVMGVAMYMLVSYTTYNEVKNRVMNQVRQQASQIENSPYFMSSIKVGFFRIQEQLFVQVVDYTNGVLVNSANLGDLAFPYPDPKKETVEQGYVSHKIEGNPFLSYQVPIEYRGNIIGLLQVAAFTGKEADIMSGLKRILIFSSLGVILVAFSIGLFIARQALRPIEHVIRAANKIENASNLSVRIPRSGPNDEIGLLTDTLNGLLSRVEAAYNNLEEAYKAQRRFVSDASHELRTPLTTIRGNIELLQRMWPEQQPGQSPQQALASIPQDQIIMTREAMHDISDEAKRMSRLVGDLLSLARADAGYFMEKADVGLLQIVEDVARRAQHLDRAAEWVVHDLEPLKGVLVYGQADYLRQLLFIFIENSFKYTPEGTVSISAAIRDGQAGIVIADTGIGMEKEEVPHIFERFYRADVSRGKTSGTGLGLSIAKWILDEHGGSVEVKTRAGEGTVFTIWLPIAFHSEPSSSIMEEAGGEQQPREQ